MYRINRSLSNQLSVVRKWRMKQRQFEPSLKRGQRRCSSDVQWEGVPGLNGCHWDGRQASNDVLWARPKSLLLLLVCMSWTITVSHETVSSSAECSRDKPPFSFVRGQDSTMSPKSLSWQNGDIVDHPHRLPAGATRRGTTARCCAGTSRLVCTAGTGSSPEPWASAVRGAAVWFGRISSPNTGVKQQRRSKWTATGREDFGSPKIGPRYSMYGTYAPV